jgi:hypothetical protein
MKGKFNFKLGVLCAILSVLLIPALAQSKEQMGKDYKEFRAQLFQKLKLSPDKEKAFLAVDDKYAAERQKITADLKKSREGLQTALAATKPDESKVKGLVSAITSDQEKIVTSFKNQRDAQLALLSPVEQGKFLLILTGTTLMEKSK